MRICSRSKIWGAGCRGHREGQRINGPAHLSGTHALTQTHPFTFSTVRPIAGRWFSAFDVFLQRAPLNCGCCSLLRALLFYPWEWKMNQRKALIICTQHSRGGVCVSATTFVQRKNGAHKQQAKPLRWRKMGALIALWEFWGETTIESDTKTVSYNAKFCNTVMCPDFEVGNLIKSLSFSSGWCLMHEWRCKAQVGYWNVCSVTEWWKEGKTDSIVRIWHLWCRQRCIFHKCHIQTVKFSSYTWGDGETHSCISYLTCDNLIAANDFTKRPKGGSFQLCC